MKFVSTRSNIYVNSAAEAIVKGLSDDGGLFVPQEFPNVYKDLGKMLDMDFAHRSAFVLGKFLTEYDKDELLNACIKAYSSFTDNEPAPVVKIDDKFFITELFHGPTLAFKDVALTLLPFLLKKGCELCGIKEKVLVLVATSGDTGKAALEGFSNKDGVKIMVFFPTGGVSDMQKLQMCTQEGKNVNVVSVKGNFDDCQTAVKKIFNSKEIANKLKEKGVILSSANSINFGRLAPQIAYYFSSYLDLVDSEEIKLGDKVDFVVPTGNFGNILAGYYAKKMGLPINKLVCASNQNNVLTEFITSGNYDKNREFFKTMSPSMDILISSNLERLVFELSDRNYELTNSRMQELNKKGVYNISEEELKNLQKEFYSDYAEEEECAETIKEIFDEYGYCLDPHTAVAVKASNEYKSNNDTDLATIILSTASPYKFSQNVYKCLTGKKLSDAFVAAEKLYEYTALDIPENIKSLKSKEVRFNESIEKEDAASKVLEFADKK